MGSELRQHEGYKVKTWPPRADKAAFSCVINPQPKDKSLSAQPLNFNATEARPPLAQWLTKAESEHERTPLYYLATLCYQHLYFV